MFLFAAAERVNDTHTHKKHRALLNAIEMRWVCVVIMSNYARTVLCFFSLFTDSELEIVLIYFVREEVHQKHRFRYLI